MPTYTVNYSGIDLAAAQKNLIAQGITGTHNTVTGAETYFAQVIFNETRRDDHFMGGKPGASPRYFCTGRYARDALQA
jgi:phenylpyruvate tautomerase PptA (4-oxalocrotonate tautomerase family)